MLVKLQEGAGRDLSRLPIVAIDGPAGAGKSTAARWLAFQLGFKLIDTGALYRCLALVALERSVPLTQGPQLALLASSLNIQFGNLEKPTDVTESEGFKGIPKLRIFCDGIDVTDAIRSPELGMAASNVSKLPEVRDVLLKVQRDFGKEGGIVMEGRDIGTVIFPDAEIKFFLTADIQSRAKRRWMELSAAGVDRPLDVVIRETQARDDQDSLRPIAPLKQASDAELIDSSEKPLEDVVSEMSFRVREFLKKRS